tara:strand:- start:490 stop:1092 length:603 start_codon:yes stop_codon:yes gene_type:complete
MIKRIRIKSLKLQGAYRALSKSKGFKKEVRDIVNRRFKSAKNNLMEGFDSHPVTKEIEGGAEASNYSGTLSYGNLFTFIGFYQEDDPVETVRTAIREKTRLLSPKTRVHSNKIIVDFEVTTPSLDELSSITPMPWEGKSWLKAIESGISGFGHYMQRRHEASRSGNGLQINRKVRGGRYKPTKYYSELLKKFRKEIISGR